MKRAKFFESLGTIQSEALLQELVRTNDAASSVTEDIRRAFSGGFDVIGEFELTVHETAAEKEHFFAELQTQIRRGQRGDDIFGVAYPPGKKLIRLVLEPVTRLD